MISTKMRSGWWSVILARASNPSSASITAQPACSKKISALRRIVLLSSITMTFTPFSAAASCTSRPPAQEALELGVVRRRHLHSDQHPAVVGAVVAIVEQADVPAAAHAVEKLHQRAGPLRKLEPEQDLVLGVRRIPADQMPDVRLGH